jgi:hypothetical protein
VEPGKEEDIMRDVGKKDKGNRERRKKPKLSHKEKRKQKREKERQKGSTEHFTVPS